MYLASRWASPWLWEVSVDLSGYMSGAVPLHAPTVKLQQRTAYLVCTVVYRDNTCDLTFVLPQDLLLPRKLLRTLLHGLCQSTRADVRGGDLFGEFWPSQFHPDLWQQRAVWSLVTDSQTHATSAQRCAIKMSKWNSIQHNLRFGKLDVCRKSIVTLALS